MKTIKIKWLCGILAFFYIFCVGTFLANLIDYKNVTNKKTTEYKSGVYD